MTDKNLEISVIRKMVINNENIKVIGQFAHLSNISRMIHDFEYFIFLFIN